MRLDVSEMAGGGKATGKEESMDVVSELVGVLMECYCFMALSLSVKVGEGDVVRLEICE